MLALDNMILVNHDDHGKEIVHHWRSVLPSSLYHLSMHRLSILGSCHAGCNLNLLSWTFELCPELHTLTVGTIEVDVPRHIIVTHDRYLNGWKRLTILLLEEGTAEDFVENYMGR